MPKTTQPRCRCAHARLDPGAMRAFLPAVLAIVACLGACMEAGDYPSLKPRAFEKAGRDAADLPSPPPAVPANPQVLARIAAFMAQAEQGQSAFAAELGAARPVIGQAGVPDSESWIMAHQRLSGLDASRAATVAALADLDALTIAGVDAAGVRLAEADLAAIRAAGEAIAALLEAQQRIIEELGASIAPA